MKRHRIKNPKPAKNNTVLTEYNLNLEYETFSNTHQTSGFYENCMLDKEHHKLSYRPKELSLAIQYLAIINKNENVLIRNTKSDPGFSLNFKPNIFDQILYEFYMAKMKLNYTHVVVFLIYIVVLVLIVDTIQTVYYFNLKNNRFLVENGIKYRFTITTVFIVYSKVFL